MTVIYRAQICPIVLLSHASVNTSQIWILLNHLFIQDAHGDRWLWLLRRSEWRSLQSKWAFRSVSICNYGKMVVWWHCRWRRNYWGVLITALFAVAWLSLNKSGWLVTAGSAGWQLSAGGVAWTNGEAWSGIKRQTSQIEKRNYRSFSRCDALQ